MPALPAPVARVWIRVRRAVLLRRRLLAAACLGVAVLAGLRTVAGPPAPTEPVLVAARNLPAGTVLDSGDLREARYAEGTAPDSGLTREQATGRTLAAPVAAGEPVTGVRLVTPGLLDGYPGLVAVPVRIPDPDTVALLRVGDRIDLLATDPGGGGTVLVASQVPVLALPQDPEDSSPMTTSSVAAGRLVVIGTTAEMSEKVADASVRRFLTVIFTG